MNQLNLFIELTRLKRPIGYMLLFWPCSWGLTLAYDFSNDYDLYFFYLLLFFLGSVLMRSAGCIINDISDKEFDKKVSRTKNRPIASGKISVTFGLFYSAILCFCALLVLVNFNKLTIILAFCSMPLAFTYPLMKRFTYWPQLFLGITFNYGLILGWTSIENEINIIPIILYFGAIFWTLGYDTVYGYQDITDDEIIGVKSTSIKFKDNPKNFLFICYLITILAYLLVGQVMNFNYLFYIGALFIIAHLFLYQLKNFDSKDVNQCFKIFKSNNLLGLIVLIFIFLGRLNI
jgi:4-hydroxybenzoate polyprenyltransferase